MKAPTGFDVVKSSLREEEQERGTDMSAAENKGHHGW